MKLKTFTRIIAGLMVSAMLPIGGMTNMNIKAANEPIKQRATCAFYGTALRIVSYYVWITVRIFRASVR